MRKRLMVGTVAVLVLAGCGGNDARYKNVPPEQREAVRNAEEEFPILKGEEPPGGLKKGQETKKNYFSNER